METQPIDFTIGEQAVIIAMFIIGFGLLCAFFYWLLETPCTEAEDFTGDDDIIGL